MLKSLSIAPTRNSAAIKVEIISLDSCVSRANLPTVGPMFTNATDTAFADSRVLIIDQTFALSSLRVFRQSVDTCFRNF